MEVTLAASGETSLVKDPVSQAVKDSLSAVYVEVCQLQSNVAFVLSPRSIKKMDNIFNFECLAHFTRIVVIMHGTEESGSN